MRMKLCICVSLMLPTALLTAQSLAQTTEQPSAQAGTMQQGRKPARRLSDENEGTSVQLEEVIVTAQRRQELLQDVPISMSVVGSDNLYRTTAEGLAETLNRVPAVATIVGGNGVTSISVRGVAAAGAAFSGSSPIGYYLDSVPFGFVRSAIAPDLNVYDLERVEVLRGPQGTLYGASAQNGVIRVLTRDADLDAFDVRARGSASTTKDGGENYRGDLALNMPIIEGKLAARAVVGYQDWSGWIDKPNAKDANDSQVGNARVKVNAQPTDAFSIGVVAWLSRTDYGAPPISDDNRLRNSSTVPEPMSVDFDVYGLKIGYDFDGVSLTSNTSYLDYKNTGTLDLRGLFLPLELDTLNSSKVFAQEVLLNSTHEGPWRWSVGGMYRDAEERLFQILGAPPALDEKTSSESIAVFGEVTRTLLDGQLELTGGLRYFEDEVRGTEQSSVLGLPADQLVRSRQKFDATSPRAVVTWHPDEQLSLYASYAEGFRSGVNQIPAVLNAAPQFPSTKPDNLNNYELGAKARLWGGRLSFDTAVYYIDWTDVQQLIGVPVGPNVTISTVINGGSASGIGAEFLATAELMDGLTVSGSFAWNDLTSDSDVLSEGAILFAKGDRLNTSPEMTASISADYVFGFGGSGFQGRFSTSANYTSEQDTRIIIGGDVVVAKGDPMTIARASFAIASPQHWTVTLFADNINDENGIVTRSVFAADWNLRVRPRTLGVQLEYEFH